MLERRAIRIRPGGVNFQCVRVAFPQHRPVLFARQQAALDASGVKQDGEPCAVRVPQFLIQLQERQINFFVPRIEQVDVAVNFTLTHRRGKMQIEFEQILGQRICRRVNLAYDCLRLGPWPLKPKGRLDDIGMLHLRQAVSRFPAYELLGL